MRSACASEVETLDFRSASGLDPALRDILIGAAAQGLPKLPQVDPATARDYFEQVCAQLNGLNHVDCATQDLSFPGQEGAIPARLYGDDAQGACTGVILFFHGGGWVIGSIQTHDAICRHLATTTGWRVLSVDYRLAPEHPFPAALDDARIALAWLREDAIGLNLDPNQIIVAGDSAGGNLAAALTLVDRATKPACPIAGQILMYPAVGHDFTLPSMQRFATGFGDDMKSFVCHYHGADAQPNDPQHSPLYATSFTNLPPALVITAGFDPLHDEGVQYATRLKAAGNTVTYRNYASLNHGFLKLAGVVPAAKDAMNEVLDLARQLCMHCAENPAVADPSQQQLSNQHRET